MVDLGGEFSFFHGIHVRIEIRIDTSISIRPMIQPFGKQVLVTSLRQDHAKNLP